MEKRKNLHADFRFYEKLYFGGRIDDKKRTLHAITSGGNLPRVYVITLSPNEGEVFGIYECTDALLQLYFQKEIYVIGVCRGHSNTMKLIQEIFDSHQAELDDFRAYWKSQSFLSEERLSL